MDRESLLPRSLFSASTLKRENAEESLASLLSQPQPQKRRRRSLSQHRRSPTRGDSTVLVESNNNLRSNQTQEPVIFEDVDDSENDNNDNNEHSNNSSSSSSSSSDEDEGDNNDIESTMLRQDNISSAHINHTMHHLLLKLERQQSKQNKYIEKLKHINKSIKKTNRLITYNANQLMQAVNSNNYNSPVPKQTTKPPLALAKRSAPLPPVNPAKNNVAVISDDDMQEQQSNKPNLTVDPPSRTRKSTNRPPFPAPVKITPVRKVFKEIDLAQSSKIDIFTPRQKKGETAFKKKPRSLLYNIANENTPRGISELMITTSMDGELHFWNAQERKKIKTIGSDHLYDTWIDDICWATPSTLAFCPPQKSEEPVKLIHIGKTSRSNVEGRIQSLDDSPHDSGISVIQSLDTGDNNTQYVEKCSFLTGGYDKSVYIWNLKRESPDDNFTTSEVNRLNLKHTSYLLSLCYDKYRSNLFSGGADERLVIFDLQTDSTIREMRLSQRVNQINQSKANPNLMLITLSSCVDQFSVYDQRCPGYDGIKLRFGQHENENLSRYIKLDMHDNGYTVCCGSQSSSKLNFWDLRYTGVSRNISFSMETPSTSKILIPKFIPNSNTIVSVSSTRTLSWLDYQVKKDEIVKTLV